MLWTKQDMKVLMDLKFTFSKDLKKRIAQLDSGHTKSKQNRAILDEIYLSVADQSPAVKKLGNVRK